MEITSIITIIGFMLSLKAKAAVKIRQVETIFLIRANTDKLTPFLFGKQEIAVIIPIGLIKSALIYWIPARANNK